MHWMLSGSIVFALELPSLAGSHLVKGSAFEVWSGGGSVFFILQWVGMHACFFHLRGQNKVNFSV